MHTIRELDVYVANALRLDPIRLGAWRAARRIEGLTSAATVRRAGASDATAESGRPAASPEAAPETEVTPKAS
jgi:hypothetical protein